MALCHLFIVEILEVKMDLGEATDTNWTIGKPAEFFLLLTILPNSESGFLEGAVVKFERGGCV